LSPAERAAFLLADVFDYGFDEVAAILGKTPEACRQLASRARRHVRDGRPRPVDRAEHEQALAAFVTACSSGDLLGLERLLAADVVVRTDHGGRARAARKPVHGAPRVARFLIGLARKGGAHATIELRELNGRPALVVREGGAIVTAMTIEVCGGRIAVVYFVRNPDKLVGLDAGVARS
jgi:RNA polymerase sigma-70 factor (ECF subfamily)